MDKSLVNSKISVIAGNSKNEAKKESLVKQHPEKTAQEIDSLLTSEKVLLNNTPKGVLLGVCADPDQIKDKVSQKISIFDDGIEVAIIDKNALIDACASNRSSDNSKGIKYTVPLLSHAVRFDYQYQNTLEVVGNITGLQFYFK